MESSPLNYILELQSLMDDQHVAVERSYYNTLQEAMASLMETPLDRFYPENPIETPEVSRIRLLERQQDKEIQIGQTFMLPIEDGLNGGPSAGLYFKTEDERGETISISAFENKLGTSFYRFRIYDQDMAMIQLARFVYDDGVKLIADPRLHTTAQHLHLMVKTPWEYELEVLDAHQPIAAHYFYHSSLPAAFDHLMSLKYFETSYHKVAAQWPEHSPILSILDRQGAPVIDMRVISRTAPGAHLSKDTIIMDVPDGLARLEALASINFSAFGDYHKDPYRLMLGTINPDNANFIPVPAFTSLQDGQNPLNQLSNNDPYLLTLHYRHLAVAGQNQARPGSTMDNTTYAELADAVAALRQIDLDSFRVATAVKRGQDKYLYEARLYHRSEGYQLASMFSVTRDSNLIVAGVYLEVNHENISADILGAFHPFLKELPPKGPLLYLVRADSQQSLERRHPQGPRYLGDGGTTMGL